MWRGSGFCFLDASLPLLRRGCPLQRPGSFVLKTLGSRRGAASNEIRARCIEGRRISVTFPCCAPLVFAQNGAAALQHAGRRQPATLECTWAGVSAASACVRDRFLLMFYLFIYFERRLQRQGKFAPADRLLRARRREGGGWISRLNWNYCDFRERVGGSGGSSSKSNLRAHSSLWLHLLYLHIKLCG